MRGFRITTTEPLTIHPIVLRRMMLGVMSDVISDEAVNKLIEKRHDFEQKRLSRKKDELITEL